MVGGGGGTGEGESEQEGKVEDWMMERMEGVE